MGEDADLEKRILNRVIKWSRDGITIEADHTHIRKILKDLELERANSRSHSMCRGKKVGAQMQEVMGARVRTNMNRDSAKPNTIGMMRVIVTTRTELR